MRSVCAAAPLLHDGFGQICQPCFSFVRLSVGVSQKEQGNFGGDSATLQNGPSGPITTV